MRAETASVPRDDDRPGRTNAKRYLVAPTADERPAVSDLIAAGKAAAQEPAHARSLPRADAAGGGPAWPARRIAEAPEVGHATIERVRQQFGERGLEAALIRELQARPSRLPTRGGRAVHGTERRTAPGSAELMRWPVEEIHESAEEVVPVMDNPNTHKSAGRYEAFPPEEDHRLAERPGIHPAPKHEGGPHMAEIEPSAPARPCPDRRIEAREELEREVAAWEEDRNERMVEVRW